MASCTVCSKPLGIGRRLLGATKCSECEKTAADARDQALADYPAALWAVAQEPSATVAVKRMTELEATIEEEGGKFADRKQNAFGQYVEQALSDEVLTQDEESQILKVGEAFFKQADVVGQLLTPYRSRIFVAMVNNGRLPTVDAAGLILKKGETAHMVERADLLKEVVQREYRGSSNGYSFRVMKGVYYRVGSQRGHMVEVGRAWMPEDSGTLTVTSQRMVFTGERRSVEMAYPKLLNLNVFTDAIQVHVSNRQKPTTLRIPDGNAVAAVVNAASQKLMA